jgi:hypothetical protein
MRILINSLVIGALTLAGALPAAAQSKPASDKSTTVGIATTRNSADERVSYTQKAQDEMRIWQQKLNDFGTTMKAKATEAHTKGAKNLDDAWARTKAASSRLEAASEADWISAKASFKSASDRLALAWHKANPADK